MTKGQKIAVLSDQQVTAALIQAKASAETAQANYDKTVNGSNSPQSIAASQLSITDAEQNLINSVETNYTTINNMIQTSIDQYFSNPESSPIFGITFIDSSTNQPVTLTSSNTNQNIELGYERASIGNVLNEWQAEISTASITSASGAVQLAQDSQKYLTTIQNFVNDFTSAVNSISLSFTKYQTYVNSANSTAASAQSTVTGAISSLTSGIQSVETAQSNLTVQEAPPIPDTLESAKASLDSANASLQTAEMNYNNETIIAPFAGKIAALNVTVGQQPSNNGSASPDVIATLITDQLLAQVSLNEVDAANVQLGDVATMTFSAIPNLTLTGKVVELDTIGTVTSGVTTYNAQIAFDVQNSQIKDGMSVTATIVTDAEPNSVLVPSGAVKTQGGTSYVLTANIPSSQQAAAISTGITLANAPTEVQVTVGNSNNTQTAITSGLSTGDYVLVRTTGGSSATVSSASSATSRSGLGALTGGGGGFGGGTFVRTSSGGGSGSAAAAAGR